jgi:hypothetical protein
MAGRSQEIFTPEMTVEHPVYRFSMLGRQRFTLDGREAVQALYEHYVRTNQCIFYTEDEELAVGDTMVVSRAIVYQQATGVALARQGVDADESDDADHDLIELDPADVLTADQAAKLLDPLIKPLPPS